ncbi:MAG: lytic murein transglycosylase [Alphaproteobacteria bacterium]
MIKQIRILAASGLLAATIFAAPAGAGDEPFEVWLDVLRDEARAAGIGAATLDTALTGVTPIPRIIELDRRQPEGTITFTQYLDRVISDARVAQGRRMLAENADILAKVAKSFGVQPRFIVALWGIETSYGNFTGGFPVIDALATLAYDGRRSDYFRRELINALRIIDDGHIAASEMKGSWAGAMGQSQFMPSSFIAYAHDYNGDGRKDIWDTRADVFASAANFLSSLGWRDDITWGRRIKLPAGFDFEMANLKTVKSLSAWQALGVRRDDGSDLPARDLPASIVRPGRNSGPSYLIYDNYRTVMKWNRSLYFATAVGILSDRIASR